MERFSLRTTAAGDHPSKRLVPWKSPVRLAGCVTAAPELNGAWRKSRCDPLLVGQEHAHCGEAQVNGVAGGRRCGFVVGQAVAKCSARLSPSVTGRWSERDRQRVRRRGFSDWMVRLVCVPPR